MALGLGPAVAAAYRRAFRPPFEIPLALVGNAVLMTAAWFLLPTWAHDWLFSLHGPLAFPVVMASWMLGDTPATNAAGLDAEAALSVLHDPRDFQVWLTARSIVLTSLVGVPCAVIALLIGAAGQPPVKVAATCLVIAVIPFGVLPITAWLGLVLPYRQRPLRWRWEHRDERLRLLRWLILLMAPFVLVPLVSGLIILPSIGVARWVFDAPPRLLSSSAYALLALVVCGVALLAGWVGIRGAGLLRSRRLIRLEAYLSDPAAG